MSQMNFAQREALDAFEPQLARKGYRLLRDPSPGELPDFLRSAAPNAIALGGPPNLLIEVLARSSLEKPAYDASQVTRWNNLLANHADWRLEVVYAPQSMPLLQPATVDQIERRSGEVRRLAGEEPAGALLLAWSLLEAAVRVLEPERAYRALSPGGLIEFAGSMGYFNREQTQKLYEAGRRRNAFAHGDLGETPPTADEVESVLNLVAKLCGELRARETAPAAG